MRKVGFPVKSLLPVLVVLVFAGAAGGDEKRLEAAYLDRTEAGLELARWCLEKGFIREMLLEVDKVLEKEAGNREALDLLHRSGVEPLALAAGFRSDFRRSAAARGKLLNRAKSRVLKMAKRSYRFNFHSDLDKGRIQDYAFMLNRYFDGLKNLFRIHKTELGIMVLLFGSRSDYLEYWQRNADANVEHWAGFFLYNDDLSLLCFYDDRANEEKVFNTAKHECTHLLVKQSLRGAHMANWLNEGLACYFAGDGEERLGTYTADCYLTVRHALRTKTAISLEKMMEMPYSEFNFRTYAFCWSWVAFLRAHKEHAKQLGRLLTRLGNLSHEPETVTWKSKRWDEETNRLFKEIVGRPADLYQPWSVFVAEDLVPVTPQQLFYCASVCLNYAGGRWDMQPPLKPSQRDGLLREGERWLREAEASGNDELKARCGVAIAQALLARAHSLEYDEREKTHAGAASRAILNRIVGDPSRSGQYCDAAYMMQQILYALQKAGGYRNEEKSPTCRLADRIAEREDVIAGEMADAGIQPDHDCDAAKELRMVRFQEQLARCLITEARYAYGSVLADDPSNREAVLGWLTLALDYAPDELELVFPYLLFHVELDPDDEMLAALAAAYAVSGKTAHAGSLIERAYSMTPKKGMLERFTRFIPED